MQEKTHVDYVSVERHWPMLLTFRITWTVFLAAFGGVISGTVAAGTSVAAAVFVPVVLVPVCGFFIVRVWRCGVWLTTTVSVADTVLVRGVTMPSRCVPVDQIMRVRASEYGARIYMIDGRMITAGALAPASRSSKRQHVLQDAVATISGAVHTAQASRAAEVASAIQAAAPQRARRQLIRAVWFTGAGLSALIGAFFLPEPWNDPRLFGIGACCLFVGARCWRITLKGKV